RLLTLADRHLRRQMVIDASSRPSALVRRLQCALVADTGTPPTDIARQIAEGPKPNEKGPYADAVGRIKEIMAREQSETERFHAIVAGGLFHYDFTGDASDADFVKEEEKFLNRYSERWERILKAKPGSGR